jgi:NitT/TauT family transport system ATP-binding protein
MSETYIEFQQVGKVFGSRKRSVEPTRALDDVNFTIGRGEFCSVIGPSGCGKSTLLRILDGLVPADEGQVLVDGVPVDGPGPDRAMVFQHFNLMPWRTVLKNVEFGLEVRGIPAAERKETAKRYLELFGLGQFEQHFPSQLSGGMQQRVGLARALAVDCSILLMDEPFGALDAQTKMLMQLELAKIWHEDRRTVLFVTHDIEEAVFLSDRIVVMSARPGRIATIVDVPFDRPRDERLRATPEFARVKDEIWQLLKKAMNPEEIEPLVEATS